MGCDVPRCENFPSAFLEFFHSCLMGATFYDCCRFFKPAFVTMRGSCFRLTNYSQGSFSRRDAASAGTEEYTKLIVKLRLPASPFIAGSKQVPSPLYLTAAATRGVCLGREARGRLVPSLLLGP